MKYFGKSILLEVSNTECDVYLEGKSKSEDKIFKMEERWNEKTF